MTRTRTGSGGPPQLSLALSAPWGPHWQATALDALEPAMITRPLELLLESLLARPAAGGINADTFEIAEAADLASEAIDASLYLHATRHRLHDLQIAVGEHGQYAITDTAPQQAATATIDIDAYLRADRADRLRLNPQPLTGTPVRLTGSHGSQPQDFTRLEDLPLPGSLRTADAVLKQALGTGIDGIKAVLGTAVTWTTGADDVTEVAQTGVREAAIAWSHLPAEQIDAALNLLILTLSQLRDEGLPYWEQERRTHRLATRPLIRTGAEDLLLIPRRIEATMDIYAACFLDGRLPWPPDAVPRAVGVAFNNFRNRQNRELERHLFQILEDAGIPFKGNIEPHHAAPFGLRLTGEIDALAGDLARSRLWVCEVKDVSAAASPRTVADRVPQVHRPPPRVHQQTAQVPHRSPGQPCRGSAPPRPARSRPRLDRAAPDDHPPRRARRIHQQPGGHVRSLRGPYRHTAGPWRLTTRPGRLTSGKASAAPHSWQPVIELVSSFSLGVGKGNESPGQDAEDPARSSRSCSNDAASEDSEISNSPGRPGAPSRSSASLKSLPLRWADDRLRAPCTCLSGRAACPSWQGRSRAGGRTSAGSPVRRGRRSMMSSSGRGAAGRARTGRAS